MSQDQRKIAHHIQRLQSAGRARAGCRLSRRAHGEIRRDGGHPRSGGERPSRDRSARRRPRRSQQPFEQSVEQAWPDRFYKHVRNSVQVRFLFPLQVALGNESHNRTARGHPLKLFNRPGALELVGLQIEDGEINDVSAQQRFGLRYVHPLYNLERRSVHARGNRLWERRVRRKD